MPPVTTSESRDQNSLSANLPGHISPLGLEGWYAGHPAYSEGPLCPRVFEGSYHLGVFYFLENV